MSVRVVKTADDDWQVWMTFDERDPFSDPFGFIVGEGASRIEAITRAVRVLEGAIDQLREPPTRERLLALCDLVDRTLEGGAS